MNILIADELKIHRFNLKVYIHQLWGHALVYEATNLNEVIKGVFDVKFDLLILALDIPGNEELEDFIVQAVKHTKVIIFTEDGQSDHKIQKLLGIGADASLVKSASKEQILTTLQFLFS